MIDLALLGIGGGMPMPNRYLSSLMINFKGTKILIDCGEGTQVSMRMLGWGFKTIDLILITHIHGDHINGLLGLLATLGNSERKEVVTIIGPSGLKDAVAAFRVLVPYLPYELDVIEVSEDGNFSYKLKSLDIKSIYVEHSSPCVAYSIHVNRSRKFMREKAEALDIPNQYWGVLQKGNVIEYNGKIIEPDMVLGEVRPGIKVSYVTDTRPTLQLPEFIKDSQILFCEGTYESNEKLDKAIMNCHMTFEEAASLAKEGEVKKLILTHFSPSIGEPNDYVDNAKNIFNESYIGIERDVITLKF